MRSQPLKKSQEEKLLDVKKSKEIYERYCIEGQSLKEILSKVDVSRSSIYRIIRKFEVENPEIANLMKKKGKEVTSSDYDAMKKEISKLKFELSKEKLRADLYEEMVDYGKEIYGIDLKKAGTKQ